MSRKSKSSQPALKKGQLAHLDRKKAALKQQLLKKRKRLGVRTPGFLEEARELYDDGEFAEVCDLIEAKLALHPEAESIDALELLGAAAAEIREWPTLARSFRKLTERMPNEIAFQVNYAQALAQLVLPYLAQTACERVVKHWPGDPLGQIARDLLPKLRQATREIYAKFPWSDDERYELAVLHEEMMYGIAVSEFAHVIPFGERLLARSPSFRPAYNNLALAYRETGRVADAIRLGEELLKSDPHNPHALVILGDSLYAQGRRREAREAWERLRTLPPEYLGKADCVTRQIEALARLDEHAAVLDVLEAAERQDLLDQYDPMTAVTYHLAGVAAARLGQHYTASKYWSTALKFNPHYILAEDNREDHEQPEGEREGPWLSDRLPWLPRELGDRLLKVPPATAATLSTEELEVQFAKLSEDAPRMLAELYPELPDLIRDALQNCAPWRDLVILLCKWSDSPVLHECLRDFALSPHGSDSVRIKTAGWLKEEGLLSDEKVTLWVKGKPTEVQLLDSKITFEGRNSFSPEVDELQAEAYHALQAHEFSKAEKMYRECLVAGGDHPSLLFNLAVAIEHQGRTLEADALRDDIVQRWPEYFFGQIHLFNQAMAVHDHERARELLKPLIKLEEYHVSEYLTLCFSHIDLELAVGQRDAAQPWMDQARQLDPDHPSVALYERKLSGGGFGLKSLFNGLWGK